MKIPGAVWIVLGVIVSYVSFDRDGFIIFFYGGFAFVLLGIVSFIRDSSRVKKIKPEILVHEQTGYRYKVCSSCSYHNHESYKFCPRCGSKF